MEKPVNPIKITNFLISLNKELNTPVWVEIQGTNALVKMDIDNTGKVTFNSNSGFPIKGFLNTETGEIRIFSERIFT